MASAEPGRGRTRLLASAGQASMGHLLARSPRPFWRLPAAGLAAAGLVRHASFLPVLRPALRALGQPATLAACLRFYAALCYTHEASRVLRLQMAKVTPEWLRARVTCGPGLPAGGAVLISPHHYHSSLANSWLNAHLVPFGRFANWPAADVPDPVLVNRFTRAGYRAYRRLTGPQTFRPGGGMRPALRLLEAGGYLQLFADAGAGPPDSQLLGRRWALMRGPAWLAQRSGKPLVPFMTVPAGTGWRLWFGEPLPTTVDGIAAGLEASIRQAPSSWPLHWWRSWYGAAPRVLPGGET